MQRTLTCPKCSSQNAMGQGFCGACGQELQYSCAQCGAVIEPTSRFCPNCGMEIEWGKQQQTRSSPAGETITFQLAKEIHRQGNMETWAIIGLAVAFVLILVPALMGWLMDSLSPLLVSTFIGMPVMFVSIIFMAVANMKHMVISGTLGNREAFLSRFNTALARMDYKMECQTGDCMTYKLKRKFGYPIIAPVITIQIEDSFVTILGRYDALKRMDKQLKKVGPQA